MWIFTKNGHLNVLRLGDSLVVQCRAREDIEKFATLLEAVAGHKHEIQKTTDGGFRFQVAAEKNDVAQAVARLVSEIDYSSLMRSMAFDFGVDPGYVLVMHPNGFQVARVNPEFDDE